MTLIAAAFIVAILMAVLCLVSAFSRRGVKFWLRLAEMLAWLYIAILYGLAVYQLEYYQSIHPVSFVIAVIILACLFASEIIADWKPPDEP